MNIVRLDSDKYSPTSIGSPPRDPGERVRHRIVIVDATGRGNARSLAEAIDRAEDGSHLVVRPGVYRERLILDRSATIVGEGNPEEIVREALTSVLVQNGCEVTGNRLAGVMVGEGGKAIVTECRVHRNERQALRVEQDGRCQVAGGRVSSLDLAPGGLVQTDTLQ